MDKRNRHGDDEDEMAFGPIPGPVGMAGAVGNPPAPPPRDPDHLICLRGPCRYYWHVVTMANEGNPEDTWEHLGIPAPRSHSHICLVNPGMEFEFTGDHVFACSRWDPQSEGELAQLTKRREAYLKHHPEHRDDD